MIKVKGVTFILLMSIHIAACAQGLALPGDVEQRTYSQTVQQSPEPPSQNHRHSFEISLGVLTDVDNSRDLSDYDVINTDKANNIFGFVAYNYRINQNTALRCSVIALNTNSNIHTYYRGVETKSAWVVPVLVGVKIQPEKLQTNRYFKPFVSVSAGPYLGYTSLVRADYHSREESYSEVTIGSRLAAGTDISINRAFSIGITAGYHFVDDFDRIIGPQKNYSGPEFAISWAFSFGRIH